MFTGLVEGTGRVSEARGDNPRQLRIDINWKGGSPQIGDSIAVDGCCLTAVRVDGDGAVFQAATETLARTTMGQLEAGSRVNIERSLRVGDRLDGHLVMGHVDEVGRIIECQQRGSALYLGAEVSPEIARFIAAQGSVTLAGVSLTVTHVEGVRFWVGLIPHTLDVTALGDYQVGDGINIEVDVLARYVARLLGDPKPLLTADQRTDKGAL